MATITKSLTIESQGTYNLTFDLWSYSEWATSAGITTSYASLAALIADEKAVRQLMTVHASVDYLANCPDSSTISTVINNNLCAKWINLRDYAFDKLSAKSNIKSVMDTADKYGYGEWGKINSTTWGPLGNVPIMTANDAPYGVASAGNEYGANYIAGYAFNPSTYRHWTPKGAGNNWLQYQFINPIIVKRVYFHFDQYSSAYNYVWTLKASNDGSTWTDLKQILNQNITVGTDITRYIDIDNENAYLYYRVSGNFTNNVGDGYQFQFYGRELTPLVPTMIADDKPRGTCFDSGHQSGLNAFKVFDNDSTTYWGGPNTGAGTYYLGYDFGYDVSPDMFYFDGYNYAGATTFKLQAYVNGAWTDVSTISLPDDNRHKIYMPITGISASKWQIYGTKTTRGSYTVTPTVYQMDFFGVDNSEKEFAQGSTRKTIYDHGVELETIETKTIGTGAVATKESNQLYISVPSSTGVQAVIGGQADFSSYSSLIAKVGNKFKGDSAFGYFVNLPVSSVTPPTGYVVVSNTNSVVSSIYPTLDISSVNGTNHAMLNAGHNASGTFKESTITEMWLE